MEECRKQHCQSKLLLEHYNQCVTNRTYQTVGRIRPYMFPTSLLASRTFIPVTTNMFYNKMRTVTPRSEIKSSKSLGNFRNILLQKIMPSAVCASSRNSERFDHMNSDTGSSVSLDETENIEKDSLPGMRSQHVNSFERRARRQIINEVEINQWLARETGMDRLRIMYATGPDGSFIQEETRIMHTMFRRTVVFGAFLSVLLATAQHSSKKEKHISKTQATVKGVMNERTLAKTVLKEAFKTTLKLTAFATSLFHLSQAIAAYRNKSSVWEYTISSALGFAVSGVGQGIKRCAVLLLGGAIAGTAGGYVVCRILTSEGLNQEQRHIDRIRHYLKQQKLSQQSGLPASEDEPDV